MTKQERTIVNEAEEEAKKNRKKILGIFPRSKKSGSQPSSGSATPNTATSAKKTSGEYEYDDDDLPPREGDIGELIHPNQSNDSVNEDESVKGISKTAGFDFKAISRELGKDIDVDKLPVRPEDVQPRVVPVVKVESIPPLERSGSAPPLSFGSDVTQDTRSIPSARSTLSPRSFEADGDDDDIGDIAGSTQQLSIHSASNLDLPSWGRSSPSPQDRISPTSFQDRISPPIPSPTSASSKSSSYGFNAWSQSSNTSAPAQPIRSAPPARPHPAEFLANPFAAEQEAEKKENSYGFGLGGWGKKSDDPWSSGKKSNSSSSGRREEEHNPW